MKVNSSFIFFIVLTMIVSSCDDSSDILENVQQTEELHALDGPLEDGDPVLYAPGTLHSFGGGEAQSLILTYRVHMGCWESIDPADWLGNPWLTWYDCDKSRNRGGMWLKVTLYKDQAGQLPANYSQVYDELHNNQWTTYNISWTTDANSINYPWNGSCTSCWNCINCSETDWWIDPNTGEVWINLGYHMTMNEQGNYNWPCIYAFFTRHQTSDCNFLNAQWGSGQPWGPVHGPFCFANCE